MGMLVCFICHLINLVAVDPLEEHVGSAENSISHPHPHCPVPDMLLRDFIDSSMCCLRA